MTALITTLDSPGFAATIERADPEIDPDLAEVCAVLDSAAARLASAGIVQWPASFLEEGARRMVALREHARRGEVFLLRYCGLPAATVTVDRVADPDFAAGWPDITGDAVYVSRLAANDLARNTRYLFGTWLLHRLAPYRAYLLGCRYVRLDCSRTNTALHDYYRDHGFIHVGDVAAPGRKSGALFQLDTWNFTPRSHLRTLP